MFHIKIMLQKKTSNYTLSYMSITNEINNSHNYSTRHRPSNPTHLTIKILSISNIYIYSLGQ